MIGMDMAMQEFLKGQQYNFDALMLVVKNIDKGERLKLDFTWYLAKRCKRIF